MQNRNRFLLCLFLMLTGCQSAPAYERISYPSQAKERTDGQQEKTTAMVDLSQIGNDHKTSAVQTRALTLSENEELINLLARGDVWQVSFAADPNQQNTEMLEFLQFQVDGTFFYSLFDGTSDKAQYQIRKASEEDGEWSAEMVWNDFEYEEETLDQEIISIRILPGKNLDPAARVDYSSLLLEFDSPVLDDLSLNGSGSTLLTTSGLSMDEANQIIADKINTTTIYQAPTPVDLPYNEAVQICWDFFRQKGLSAEQTAGILGNIKEESDFQFQVTSSGGMYFGLFQLASMRQAAMFEMGGDENIYQQLEYIWQENFTIGGPYSNKNYMALQTNTFGSDYRGGCIDFNEKGHTVEEYAIAWMMNVERCWTPETDWQKGPERAASARYYYELLA